MYHDKYIIEVRDADGRLDSQALEVKRKEHPFLFSRLTFTIDDLCYYASYGSGRNKPIGPSELKDFMDGIGISYRPKTW